MFSIGSWPDDWARFWTWKYRDPAACPGLFHLFEPQSEAVPQVRLVLTVVNALKHCHLTINAPFTQAQCDMSATEECLLNQNKTPSDTDASPGAQCVWELCKQRQPSDRRFNKLWAEPWTLSWLNLSWKTLSFCFQNSWFELVPPTRSRQTLS